MEQIRKITAYGFTIIALVATLVLFINLWQNRFDPVVAKLVVDHFPAIIGLPARDAGHAKGEIQRANPMYRGFVPELPE